MTDPGPEPDPAAVEDAIWIGYEDDTNPPVIPSDRSGIGIIRRISETYPAPTRDAETGRPVDWAPSSTVEEEWGTIGITVGGVDVTKVRGVKTELEQLTMQEPFGEGPAQVTIGGATWWDYGTEGFEWLDEEQDVYVDHLDPAGDYCCTLWSGVVLGLGPTATGWDLDLMGAFAGPAGMFPHRPKLTELERDWGLSLTYAIRRASQGAARRRTLTAVEFGITTRDRGARSETLLEYVSRGLSMSQTETGAQWTLARDLGVDGRPVRRKYEWRLKDRVTEHLTAYAGARGCTIKLRRDLSEVARLVMGEGVAADGARWRNTKLPNVGKETVPLYPGTPLTIGSTGDAVEIWQAEVSSDGYPVGTSEALGSGVFGELEEAAAEAIQAKAGLPVTGIVDEDTWDATWSNGDEDLNLGGAAFHPLATDPRVEPWLYSSNGSVLAANPAHDTSVFPFGRFESFGQNVAKSSAARYSRSELARASEPSWRGTITWDGIDPPEMSRLDILEGMNIRVAHSHGEPLLHIAGVNWARSGAGFAVTCHVDEKARDRLSLAAIANRNREAKQDPHRLAIAQLRRSAQVRDTPGVWDSEGGFGVLPERDTANGSWKVFVIAGGQYGSLARVRMRCRPATRFCLALFGASPGTSWLNTNFPEPLADQGDTDYRYWDRPSVQSDLRTRLFIEAWGEYKQAGGYSPGYETHPTSGKATGHSVTGVLDVNTSTDYALALEPRMYVAVWAEDVASISGRVYLLPNE